MHTHTYTHIHTQEEREGGTGKFFLLTYLINVRKEREKGREDVTMWTDF
jgi:hypothetical protein